MKKVLVTGVAGYIGSVLTIELLNRGYHVRGLDILNFGGESLLSFYNHPNFKFLKGDIRKKDVLKKAIQDIDSVVHLAAIVGDPACAQQSETAEETNWTASKYLFDLCNESPGIERFIFASTCSNYGKMEGNGYVNEDSPLKPISLYAELKVRFEKYLLQSQTRDGFTPTSLRFSTVYGVSPRIRFDLTINEFTREIFQGNELIVFGEQFWRPYCHVSDIARAVIITLESEDNLVNHNVFGVGDTKENYQKQTIVNEILKLIPDGKIKYVFKEEDPRDYRVDFTKIQNILGFKPSMTLPDGIREIYQVLKDGLLSNPYALTYSNT